MGRINGYHLFGEICRAYFLCFREFKADLLFVKINVQHHQRPNLDIEKHNRMEENQKKYFQYENRKKSVGAAVGLEILLPFAGCIYSQSGLCAVSNAFSLIFLFAGYVPCHSDYNEGDYCRNDDRSGYLVGFVGLRLLSVALAGTGASNFNKRLKERLGFEAEASVLPEKNGAAGQLSFRF